MELVLGAVVKWLLGVTGDEFFFCSRIRLSTKFFGLRFSTVPALLRFMIF